MKKALSLFLVFLLLIVAVPLSAYAEEADIAAISDNDPAAEDVPIISEKNHTDLAETGAVYYGTTGGCSWQLNTDSGQLEVWKLKNKTGKMDAYSDTNRAPWYSHRSYIKGIYIASDVINISSYAFYNLTNVTVATIPSTVATIGNHAFENCTSLQSIKLPDSIEKLGEYAFKNCTSLSSIDLSNITDIQSGTFEGCSSLENVDFAYRLEHVGIGAFIGCTSLKEITLPVHNFTLDNFCFGYVRTAPTRVRLTGFTIYGYAGTEAEAYAQMNGFTFIPFGFVDYVAVSGIVQPVGGEHPSYNISVPADKGYEPDNSFNTIITENGVYWIDENNNPLSRTDTFTAGKKYTVHIFLRISDEKRYAFSYDTMGASINGASYGITRDFYKGMVVLMRTYTAGYPSVGYTVSGTSTSYLNNSDAVTMQLLQGSTVKYTTAVSGNSANYSFPKVGTGNYTLRVSKKNHVTRDYSITVSGNKAQNVQINPIGDVTGDGKVTTLDFARANAHAKGAILLTGYELKCGDVVGDDGKITTLDAAKINAHAKGAASLWQ